MNQVLSQSEVEQLLGAVQQGIPETSKKEGSAALTSGGGEGGRGKSASDFHSHFSGDDVVAYDLTNQDRVIRGRMPTLDIIYERFIRLFRMSLSNSLRRIATLSIVSTDLIKFGEFANTLPIPSCMGILRFDGLKGSGLIVFESKLAYALVDSFFGGTDRVYSKVDNKEFTRIEMTIMRKVMELAIKDMEEAWVPVHKLDISVMRTEVNPQFVGVVPPSDVVVATTFEVELENASGTISFVIPYSTLEPVKQKLNAQFQTETDHVDREWTDKIEEHIRSTDMNVQVNLGSATISVADLVNLSMGDVIPLTQDADGELNVLVEGVPKFKCLIGASRGNRAIQVTRVIEAD